MAKTNSNGKKRQSPSVERQLALALVRVIECLGGMDDLRERITAVPEGAKLFAELGTATDEARQVLTITGYADLESIANRVARIQDDIAEALRVQDGAKLAQLGAALDRAKKGLPPLPTEKKPRAPRKAKTPKPVSTAAAVTKPRKKKSDTDNALPLGEAVPVQCLSCPWEGVGSADSKCPKCGNVVALDVTEESGAANA